MSGISHEQYYQKIIDEREPAAWTIGEPISFATIKEVEVYETEAIRPCTDAGPEIDSNDWWRLWEGRLPLSEATRIPRFNGNYVSIELLPVATEPHGIEYFKSHKRTSGGRSSDRIMSYPNSFNSFFLSMLLETSRGGIIGYAELGLMYGPVPFAQQNHRTGYRAVCTHPVGLARFLTQVVDKKASEETVRQIRDESVKMAISVYRHNLSRPTHHGGNI